MSYTAVQNARSRADFPALAGSHDGQPLAFLDGPGGSQVPNAVIDAMRDFYVRCNVNTRGNYPPSREVDRRLLLARRTVAAFLGAADANCISFGQNMTSLSFALSAAIGRTLRSGDEVLITQLDHEANRGPWLRLRDQGIVIREVRMLESGELDAADMTAKITTRTKVFALGAASNALGTVNDIALARRLTHDVGAMLVVDAVHYAPHFAIDVEALDVDFLLCSGYKYYGPHVGVLYSRPGALERLPTDRLATQDPAAPYRIETGTLNHAAIDGLRAAVEYIAGWGEGADVRARIVDAMNGIAVYERELARYYYEQVRALPGVRVWGPAFAGAARSPTVSITMPHHTAGEAAAALGARGICVWDGDFYASRAVELLGVAGLGGLLRTGILMYNTRAEVDRLLAGIEALVH